MRAGRGPAPADPALRAVALNQARRTLHAVWVFALASHFLSTRRLERRVAELSGGVRPPPS